jgi:5'-nucleotidase
MRILLTNDDGIHAPGMAVLEAIARQFSDDVWICAPSEEQSGAGHSLSLHQPVRLRKHGEKRFSVRGTPTDSVNLALRVVLDRKPDVILSGVNRGANLGDDVTYSGTVSAALEGALAGIRSIALSQTYEKANAAEEVSFSAAEQWGVRAIAPIINAPFADRTLVNINFPPLPGEAVRGIRVARQGFHDYARSTVVKGTDPRGFDYYWFGLHGIERTPGHATDLEAIADGFVSVTPLQLDYTHDPSLAMLSGRYA